MISWQSEGLAPSLPKLCLSPCKEVMTTHASSWSLSKGHPPFICCAIIQRYTSNIQKAKINMSKQTYHPCERLWLIMTTVGVKTIKLWGFCWFILLLTFFLCTGSSIHSVPALCVVFSSKLQLSWAYCRWDFRVHIICTNSIAENLNWSLPEYRFEPCWLQGSCLSISTCSHKCEIGVTIKMRFQRRL